MHRTCWTICLVLAMTADATTIMRRADRESELNLEMQGITRSHDKEIVSVDPQGDLELLGTSGRKKIVGLSVTKKDEAAEEKSDAGLWCSSHSTGWNDGGRRRRNNGRTYYLDRHSVDCGTTKVMRQWKLQRSGGSVRINYQCCEVLGGVERIHPKKTTSRHGGDEHSLDGLVNLGFVDCGNNLLQQWKVHRGPFEIAYWCAKPKFASVSGLSMIHGPGQEPGGLVYLDRQNVACPNARPYLSKWDIWRTDEDIKMVYGCVIAETPAPTAAPSLMPSPTPDPTPSPLIGGACPRGSTLTTIPAMDGEAFISWVLASNGTVFGSGQSIFTGSKTKVFTEYLTGVKAIASGWYHTLFLMENGVVCGRVSYFWFSPLCDAAISVVKDAVVVVTGVKSFSTHSRFSIFLKENNDLYGCGEDQSGNLGQGSGSKDRRTPVLVKTCQVRMGWQGKCSHGTAQWKHVRNRQ